MQKKDVWGFLVILGHLVSVSSAGLVGQGAMKTASDPERLKIFKMHLVNQISSSERSVP